MEELEELVQTADPLEKEDTKEHWEGFDPGVSGAEENMAVWNCPSCGAQLITEKTAGAAVCPYCSGPMVMPEQFEGVYRPDFVIPFSKSKKDALEALKQHYLGKPLLPVFSKKKTIWRKSKQFMSLSGFLTWMRQAGCVSGEPGPDSGRTGTISIQRHRIFILSDRAK